MAGILSSATVKSALAAWLLLTNLSLGQYHRHEPGSDAHRAAAADWHYHVLLLGVELEFLSVNAECCPFQTPRPTDGEAHLLLSNLLAPATDHDADLSVADHLTLLPLLTLCDAVAPLVPAPAPVGHDVSSLPPPSAALAARSGVQQV